MSRKGKNTEQILLMPGAEGWEIWSGHEALTLLKASGEREALMVDGVPNGELTMAFSVRDVTAAPFVAATGDREMFQDLADLHLERSGLQAEDAAGSLSDCFTLQVTGEEAILLPVVLSPPLEGGLPKRSPQSFDISAHCLPLPSQSVLLWREFGRWVFAVSNNQGSAVYFQALPGAIFDGQIAREVALSIAQLTMQEVLTEPLKECQIWTSAEEIRPSQESLEHLEDILKIPVRFAEKPPPRFPVRISKLLPADIRAERVALQKSRQIKLAVTAGLLLYLGTVGFFAWDYFKKKKQVDLVQKKAEQSGPIAEQVAEFTAKWDELTPLVENQYWPIEQFHQACLVAPKNGLRLKVAEMHNEIQYQGGQVLKRFIILQGESTQTEQAVQFGEGLTKSTYFQNFEWNISSPSPTKTGGWSFNYTAEPVGSSL